MLFVPFLQGSLWGFRISINMNKINQRTESKRQITVHPGPKTRIKVVQAQLKRLAWQAKAYFCDKCTLETIEIDSENTNQSYESHLKWISHIQKS